LTIVSDLRFAIRQLQVCRKFTLEFTTIVLTICIMNSNGWSHTDYMIIVSSTTV